MGPQSLVTQPQLNEGFVSFTSAEKLGDTLAKETPRPIHVIYCTGYLKLPCLPSGEASTFTDSDKSHSSTILSHGVDELCLTKPNDDRREDEDTDALGITSKHSLVAQPRCRCHTGTASLFPSPKNLTHLLAKRMGMEEVQHSFPPPCV